MKYLLHSDLSQLYILRKSAKTKQNLFLIIRLNKIFFLMHYYSVIELFALLHYSPFSQHQRYSVIQFSSFRLRPSSCVESDQGVMSPLSMI